MSYVKNDTIYLEPKFYLSLLSAPEYSDILCFGVNGNVYINTDKMPKKHYIPLNARTDIWSYVYGLTLCWRINEISEQDKKWHRMIEVRKAK